MKFKNLFYGFMIAVFVYLAGCQGNEAEMPATVVPTTALTSQAAKAATAVLPTPTTMPAPATCTLTAQADVTVYQRPSNAANHFSTIAAGETAEAIVQTDDGWLNPADANFNGPCDTLTPVTP